MSEEYLLVNLMDGHNRRWLEQHIGSKPQDVQIVDWNAEQERWRAKQLRLTISAFPTFVQTDGAMQFFVTQPIDWQDAYDTIARQKDALSSDGATARVAQEYLDNRLLLAIGLQAVHEERPDDYLLSVWGVAFPSKAIFLSELISIGERCSIDSSRISQAYLL